MESVTGRVFWSPKKSTVSTRSLARTFVIELHLVGFGSWSYGPSDILTTTCLIGAYCIGSRNSKGGNDDVDFGLCNFWKFLVTTWTFVFRDGLIDFGPYKNRAILSDTRFRTCGAPDFTPRGRMLGVVSLVVWRCSSGSLHLTTSFCPSSLGCQCLFISTNGFLSTLTGFGIRGFSYILIWMFLCRYIAFSLWCSFIRFTNFFTKFRFFGVSTLSVWLCLSRYIIVFEEFQLFGCFHAMSRSEKSWTLDISFWSRTTGLGNIFERLLSFRICTFGMWPCYFGFNLDP